MCKLFASIENATDPFRPFVGLSVQSFVSASNVKAAAHVPAGGIDSAFSLYTFSHSLLRSLVTLSPSLPPPAYPSVVLSVLFSFCSSYSFLF